MYKSRFTAVTAGRSPSLIISPAKRHMSAKTSDDKNVGNIPPFPLNLDTQNPLIAPHNKSEKKETAPIADSGFEKEFAIIAPSSTDTKKQIGDINNPKSRAPAVVFLKLCFFDFFIFSSEEFFRLYIIF